MNRKLTLTPGHCPSNLPQQSESPRRVGERALLSSRLRYSQSFCPLYDRTPILHLLVRRKTRLMNLDHGLFKLAPQLFRGSRAVRLRTLGLEVHGLDMVCIEIGRAGV